MNITSKDDRTYDAIIVGSGISGGWAAKELCEKGLKVLLLERGKPVEHPNYATSTKNPWDFTHRGILTEEEKLNAMFKAGTIHSKKTISISILMIRKIHTMKLNVSTGYAAMLWAADHCFGQGNVIG